MRQPVKSEANDAMTGKVSQVAIKTWKKKRDHFDIMTIGLAWARFEKREEFLNSSLFSNR